MKRIKFELTSDQLELLIAFEQAKGLAQLSELMLRDPSVISRNLQKMAEDFPVLEKKNGRWALTALGLQTNELTRNYLDKHSELLSQKKLQQNSLSPLNFTKKSALVIINAQNGLFDATQAGRNNSEAENNIAKILEQWRKTNRPVIHVKHISENPNSMFYRKSSGSEFLDSFTPLQNEFVVEKNKSSAFADTTLEDFLIKSEIQDLVLTGFTANECISTTAQDASLLSFTTFVAGDATATFDLRDPAGKLIKAEKVHKLTLTNIHNLYANVIDTESVITEI